VDWRPGTAPDTVRVYLARPDGDERQAARRLVLRAAAASLAVAPARLWVDHDPGGRPVLRGAGPGVHISVSHGRGVVAAALSARGPIGVDVEVVRPVPAVELARRWFAAEEAGWVLGRPEPERAAAFLWLWTCKEALGKALGTGLRGGGLRRPVPLPGQWPAGPAAGATLRPLPGEPALALATPTADDGVLLAVAGGGTAVGAPVEVRPG
jgi:4'-phosphopantetheinyl transferase